MLESDSGPPCRRYHSFATHRQEATTAGSFSNGDGASRRPMKSVRHSTRAASPCMGIRHRAPGGSSHVSSVPLRVGGTMLWWSTLLYMVVLSLHTRTSAHLEKEFTSARREAARSIEPDKGSDTDDIPNLDMAAVLCEKYNEWSRWSPCTRKCDQTRVRRCRIPEECGRSWVKEKRTCTREKGACFPLTYKVIGMQKRNRLIEELLYDLLYDTWSTWGACTRSCRQRRQRHCKQKSICVRSYIQEERRCQSPGSQCEHRFSLKPLGLSRGEMTSKTDQFVRADAEEDDEDTATNFGEKDGDGDGGPPDDTRKLGVSTTSRLGELLTTSTLTTAVGGRTKGRKGALSKDELEVAQSECGIRPSQSLRSYRVVGGQEVQVNSWPWQVAILTKYQEQYCGGTLIAPRWVLTAAHCVKKNNRRRKLVVRVGEHDIQHFDPTQEDIRTEEEFPHPDFDYQTITNDIALIRLKHPPSAFTHPGYACLPSPEFKPQRDKPCTIVGWGKLKNTHIYGSDSLQEAKVPVVGHQKCRRVFDYNITSTQVCAGYKRGGTDSCAGDSGGPLLCTDPQDDKEKYYLYGVTSYGEGCGRKGKYGIYTKVSSYLDWIHRTIKDNS